MAKKKSTEKHLMGMRHQNQRWLMLHHSIYEQNSSYLANFN